MKYTDDALLQRRLAGELPRIDIAGHPFIIDWRLKELRPVDDLSSRLDLKRMAMDADGLNYLCFYHIPTRSELHIDEAITEMPKDTVMLTIPYELKLDPVGVAREYGLDDTYLLHSYPILPDLKAKVTPLEETALPDMILRNKKKQKNIKTNKKQSRRKRGL
jgi:hypothetical protein